MPGKRIFHCIAAMDLKRGIGRNNDLPWNLPNEYKHFVKITKDVTSTGKQNAVIMGKNTWYSIPEKFRPLKGRLNVVISSSLQSSDLPNNVLLCRGLSETMELMNTEPYVNSIENIFITGGSNLYKEAMQSDLCGRIYLTKVEGDFNCDVFYPEFDSHIFKEITVSGVPSDIQEEKGVKYNFHVYEREK